MKEFGMLQPKALALVFVLGFLVDPTLPQQVESITQGRTISIGEDVRMLRNVDTHRMFTIRQSVGFTVEFEEDILSGGSWILDTLQTGGAVEVLPTTGPSGLLPQAAAIMVESQRFSSRMATDRNPIITLDERAYDGTIDQTKRRDTAAFQHMDMSSTGLAYESTGHYYPIPQDTQYGSDGNPVLLPGGNSAWRRFDFKSVRPGSTPRIVWHYMKADESSPESRPIPLDVVFDIHITA